MQHWRITGNSNVAIKTGSTYISDSMTDITAIPTANLEFSTMPSAKKLTAGDRDEDRQPETAIYTFWAPILRFLVFDHCCHHLANLLSSWSSSKIPNLAWEFRRYLSQFQKCNSDRHFRLSLIIGILQPPKYTSCKFAMDECHRFAVGILKIYVTVSEILLLPVTWLPCCI